MVRFPVSVLLSLCLLSSAWAQPAPGTVAGQSPIKPAPRIAAKPSGPAETEHCQIGVIPIAGNLFWIETFGPTTFNNKHVRAAADGWGLDDLVVSRVRAAAHGAAVRRIPFSREELTSARYASSPFHSANSRLRDFVRQVAAGTNCERYVVVHRIGGGKPVFGIGIVKYASLFDSQTFLFVLMNIQIYDGQTFELIKESPARINDESLLARAYLNPVGGPYRALDERQFPASRAEAVANPILRDGVRALLAESLDKTLPAVLAQSAKEIPK